MERRWIKRTGLHSVDRHSLQEGSDLGAGGESYGGHFL